MNRRGYEDTPKDVFFASCAYPEDTGVGEHLIFRILSSFWHAPSFIELSVADSAVELHNNA